MRAAAARAASACAVGVAAGGTAFTSAGPAPSEPERAAAPLLAARAMTHAQHAPAIFQHTPVTPGASISRSFSAAAASAPTAAVPFPGPGASDILSLDLIAEHRTHQRFRTRRAAQPRPPVMPEDAPRALPTPADGSAAPARPAFPDPALPLPGAAREEYLLGANTRCMLGWCRLAIARAYAFGLYADEAAIRTGISRAAAAQAGGSTTASASTATTPAGPLPLGSAALAALLDAKEAEAEAAAAARRGGRSSSTGLGPQTGGAPVGEVSLVLMMNRDIPGDHLAHGFRNSALARMASRAKEREKERQAKGQQQGGTVVTAVYPAVDRSGALTSGKAAAGVPASTPLPGVSMSAVTGGGSSNGLPLPSGGAAAASSSSSNSSTSSSSDDAVAQLSSFVQAFNGWQFATGDEISLVWAGDGTLLTSFRGQLVPGATLSHPGVIRALLDVYCGPSPVSARAKESFERNLGMLAGRALENGSTTGPGGVRGDDVVRVVLAEHATRVK